MRAWLAQDSNSNVVVYVVWSDELGARETNVSSAAQLVADRRARHYWDGAEVVGRAFDPVLGLPIPAWDTWMLFDGSAMWHGDRPPAPAWWEHQLSAGPPERHLDPERFAAHAESIEAQGGRPK